MRVLIALLFAFPVLSAQETFTDSAFDYSMTLPPGMSLTTAEEQAALFGQPVESFENKPRSTDDPDAELSHINRWRDTTGRDRNITLLLNRGAFPFSSPDQFKELIHTTMQVDVDVEDELKPPEFPIGMRVEGTKTRSDGALIRQTDALMVISIEPPCYAILRFECLDLDWSLMWPEFLDCLHSVDLPQPEMAAGGGPPQRGGKSRRRAGAAGGGAGMGPQADPEDWDTLEVTGSLLVAVLLLLGLFMGGRAATAA